MLELMVYINAYLLKKLPEVCELSPSEGLFPSNTLYPGRTFPDEIPEDFFPGDADFEVMCRHDVAPVVQKRFMDGSYKAGFNFSYYCKSKNVIQARQTLEAIIEALNIQNFQGLFGLTEGRLEAVTRPTPVSEDESGVKVYTSSFQLVYSQEV